MAVIRFTNDENNIRICGLKFYVIVIKSITEISGLEITSWSLHYKGMIEKRSTIDNDDIRSTGLEISDLGKTGSSFYYDGHLQRYQGISKSLSAYFCIKSSILLWQHCIIFFIKFLQFFFKIVRWK